MPTSLQPVPSRVSYQSTVTVTPEAWLAAKLGRTAAGVHQLLYAPFRCGLPLNELAALSIRAFVHTDAADRLANWAAPIRAAFADLRGVELSASLFRTARAADSEDDKSIITYVLDPTAENGRRVVSDIDRTIARLLEVRGGIVAKHNLERQ